MQCTLMFPDTEIGYYFEKLAHFAARRARTLKSHTELLAEIQEASDEKRQHFLHYILTEEWSLDVAEMNIFIYDIEGVPSWLMTEFLRHRLIARDWSFEQRSKRAIHSSRMAWVNPFDKDSEPIRHQQMQDLGRFSQKLMDIWRAEGVPAEKLRYAALEATESSFVCASNARALHHLFTLRGSEAIGAEGKAAPEFMELVDMMMAQAQTVCPNLFATLLRS